MTIEDQVCSLELSKHLKELGVEQESLFYWTELHDGDEWATDGNEPRIFNEKLGSYIQSSAFTVAELGEMLPVTITVGYKHFYFCCNKTIHNNRCGYESENGIWGNVDETHLVGEGKTESDARAKMLIYLLENNLVKI